MKELADQKIEDYTLWEGTYNPKNIKQCIAEGHHRIIQYAKDNNLESVFFGEDDMRFTSPNSYKYFISQIPKSYDLFFSIIYAGKIENNRVMNGFSGGFTLLNMHNRFYQTFLDMPTTEHVDRYCGNFCHQYEYYVVPEYCAEQRGGMSHQLKRSMFYDAYLRDKTAYNG